MRNRRIAEEILEGLHTAKAVETANPGGGVLAETLQNVMAMLGREDEGWELYIGGNGRPERGLSLKDLKAWERKLTEFEAGNAWGKRGLSLRDSYINQDEVQYEGIRKGGSGKGVNVQEKIDHPLNQKAFFGRAARRRREGRLYHSGIALWIGDDSTKLLTPIPLDQITDVLTDEDDTGEIYAYRRAWSRRQANGKKTEMVRWYFVDTYKHLEQDIITVDKEREKVERGYTAFDMHANSVEGWAFGIPDALAAHVWAEIAKGLYMDGVDVSEAMASIAYKATAGTAKSGQAAAGGFASPQAAASTAIVGSAGDLVAMNSAKSGYTFSTIREVVALIASALDVSVIHLTANPGDAGSSYGASQTLDLPTRLAMITRRQEHADLDKRVLRWMAGSAEAASKIKAYFPRLVDPAEQYREMQMATLPWLQGVLEPETFQEIVAKIMGRADLGTLPKGILTPNNKDSLPRKDIDRDGTGGTATTSAPMQGRGSGDGGGAGGERPTDTRNDIQSN
jgi:hypothetical protein